MNGTATKWTFKDRNGTVADHVTKVVISDLSSRAPGLYKFKVTGRGGDFQVKPGQDPVHVVVVLGVSGQCASVAFNGVNGPAPLCQFATNGKTLNCR